MASMLDVGYVAAPGEDIFPTTGPHLDVRVLKDGKYIDPGTIRSLLTRLKVGKERKPLWQQQGEEWKPGFTITSPFGKRTAPTAGASTQHMGQDYAVAAKTPLTWEGPGAFTPGKGYGTIKTTDPQGTPYEIRLLHTKGGKPAELQGQQALPTQQQTAPGGDTYIYVLGGKKKEGEDRGTDFLSSYIQDSLFAQQPQVKSMINPAALLTSAFSQTPNYMT
jgi:hypothetical protein